MHSTALLALRIRGFRNRLSSRQDATVGGLVVATLFSLMWAFAIAGGTGVALAAAFDAAAAVPAAQRALETIALTMVASAVIVLGFIVDNGTAASLLTADVDRLLTSPVLHRAVVRAKIVANLPSGVLVLVPGLIAI